jgi:hypothetical protein
MTALASLLKESFVLSDTAKSDPALAGLASRIERGETAPGGLRSQAPEWVAARLWDRALTDTASRASELRVWVDRWRLLGWPSLVAHRVWSETAANTFRETALGVLAIFKAASTPGASRYNPANTRRSMLVKVSRCVDLRRSTLS